MTSTHILRGVLLSTLLVPMSAFAGTYLSPEEVLSSDNNAQYFTPPPSPRQTEDIQAQQQANDAARRNAEQQAIFGMQSSASASSVTSDDSMHSAAPDVQPTTNGSGLSPEDQRILERVKANQQQAQFDAAVNARIQMLSSQESLHSGAPLSSSGPGTILSAFLLAGAGIWTLWKAKRLEQQK